MKLTVNPGNPLRGDIRLPGDKSISHRAALFSALAHGESVIENFLVAGVTKAMLHALTEVGVEWSLTGPTLKVKGKGLNGLLPPANTIHCGNSGTTLRLLAGALSAANISCTLSGSNALCQRPMLRIVEPLQRVGAVITATSTGTAPMKLKRRLTNQPLSGKTHILPIASAQVKTCLLLAGLNANEVIVVDEPALSRDHTEKMLSTMGIHLVESFINERHQVQMSPLAGNNLSPLRITIPGDFSSASFLIVAALITPGSEITIRKVGLNPTRTGLLSILTLMGAHIDISNEHFSGMEPVGDLRIRHSKLHGIEVSGSLVVKMIDEFPVFAIAAAFAEGETLVTQAEELRYKESDRISTICTQLKRIGVVVEERCDGFLIRGDNNPTGGEVNPNGDHRLAMAFAVSGLGSRNQITIHDAGIFNESYPRFVEDLIDLGADIAYE
jgi:3-phosphoshikimate 1-carboxyvinyltransferase